MKVAELQRFLGNVVPFAKAAGASDKAAAELDRALQCLEPFKEQSLADFSDFLRRADEFDRTGKLTPPVQNGNGRSRSAKAGALSVDDAAQIFKDLLARANDPALTYPDIDAALKTIGKLKIGELLEVAAKVGVPVPAKPKPEIMAALTRRIRELKASAERTQNRFSA